MARLPAFSRAGRLWVGLVALALAFMGQHTLGSSDHPVGAADVQAAILWYGLAIAVLLAGWRRSYANQSLLAAAPAPDAVAASPALAVPDAGLPRPSLAWFRSPPRSARLGVTLLALALNLASTQVLHTDWTSIVGGALWVASVGLMLLACVGERAVPRGAAARVREGETQTARWPKARTAEIAVFLAIMGLAATMRLWRLGDPSTGMHGDEGEAGVMALQILNGNLASPFTPGWFNQPYFYYYSIALCMKFFGTGLVGLRLFAVLCGLITVCFVYLIAREMFGRRAAIIAGCLIACQSADVTFSRQEFSNITTPTFLTVAMYFLVRGLRSRRHLDFVLAGIVAGFSLYYFAGGRLVGPVAGALLVYLTVCHRAFLRAYWTRVAAFCLAYYLVAAPFVRYFVMDHPIPPGAYPNDRFIWFHYANLASQYNASGWPAILWNQLIRTLSIITHDVDVSAMNTLDYPIAQPFEASLIILGLAWAAWRWRDTRFALLSLWFWSSVIGGGVLTIDAPSLPRLVGMLPALALLIAAVLDHLAAQGTETSRCEDPAVPAQTPRTEERGRGAMLGGLVLPALRTGGNTSQAVSAGLRSWGSLVVVAGVVATSGVQNWTMFMGHYLSLYLNSEVTQQALYVHRKGPGYFFYDMAAPQIYFGHGDNRFMNPDAEGADVVNLPDYLPLMDRGPDDAKGVAFLVWPQTADYLAVLRAYYPEGLVEAIPLGNRARPTGTLVGFAVTRQQIEQHRVVRVRYMARGNVVHEGVQGAIGSAPGSTPSLTLRYPVDVTWSGAVVVPSYDSYRFELSGPPRMRLLIDGATVTFAQQHAALRLARGPHSISLSATLASPTTRVDLLWSLQGGPFTPIARRYLWDNHIGQAWSGEVHALNASDPLGQKPAKTPAAAEAAATVWSRRIDGFLGFRSAQDSLAQAPFSAHWVSTLEVPRAGRYGFDTTSNGDSMLGIDGHTVVLNVVPGTTQPHTLSAWALLGAGRHRVDLWYTWSSNAGFLECGWTPPGAPRQLFISPALRVPPRSPP